MPDASSQTRRPRKLWHKSTQTLDLPTLGVNAITCFKLDPGADYQDEAFKETLQAVKDTLEVRTEHPFTFLKNAMDDDYIYLVGRWESLHDHLHRFLYTNETLKIMTMLFRVVSIQWVRHYDIENDLVEEMTKPRVMLERLLIRPGKKDAFLQTFNAVNGLLRNRLSRWFEDRRVIYAHSFGWRVQEEAEGRNELLMVSAYKDNISHHNREASKSWGEYSKVYEFIELEEHTYTVPIALRTVLPLEDKSEEGFETESESEEDLPPKSSETVTADEGGLGPAKEDGKCSAKSGKKTPSKVDEEDSAKGGKKGSAKGGEKDSARENKKRPAKEDEEGTVKRNKKGSASGSAKTPAQPRK